MHDGSTIRLHKLDADHDCRDRSAALATLERHRAAGEIVTGLIYLERERRELHERLGTTARPLNELGEAEALSRLEGARGDQRVAALRVAAHNLVPGYDRIARSVCSSIAGMTRSSSSERWRRSQSSSRSAWAA